MCIHDDPAALCLPKNSGQTNHRKHTGINNVAQYITCANRWELIDIPHQYQTHSLRNCFEQRVHQYHVDHRTLINDQHISLQRVILIFLIAFRWFALQQTMNGLCLQSSCFRHTLGRAPGGSCQQDFQSKRTVCSDNSLSCRGFTGSRAAGQHHHFGNCCLADGVCLNLIIFHMYFFLNFSDINRQTFISCLLPCIHQCMPEPVCCRCLRQTF